MLRANAGIFCHWIMPQSGSPGASNRAPSSSGDTPNADRPSGSGDQRKPSNLPPMTERRKGHKKSRTGCKTCKKRKVKACPPGRFYAHGAIAKCPGIVR